MTNMEQERGGRRVKWGREGGEGETGRMRRDPRGG